MDLYKLVGIINICVIYVRIRRESSIVISVLGSFIISFRRKRYVNCVVFPMKWCNILWNFLRIIWNEVLPRTSFLQVSLQCLQLSFTLENKMHIVLCNHFWFHQKTCWMIIFYSSRGYREKLSKIKNKLVKW